MPFFQYRQNNSGGGFDEDKEAGIGYAVIIEAANAEQANSKAESIGLYFNGCAEGMDCDCCGDRWYEAWSDEGDPEPRLYNGPVKGGWGLSSFVHYADGRIEEYAPEKSK